MLKLIKKTNRKLRKIISKNIIQTNRFEGKEKNSWQRIRTVKSRWSFLLFLLDEIIMHTKEFILIPKRMFITKQPQKSEIIENPQYKNKSIQLSLMQRNKLREDIGKTDRVIQTDPTNIERDVDKADRVVQTDPTIFNEEEKMEASSDDSEMDPIVTKKPTVESFESIMKNVKLKEAHKVKRAEIVLDLILQSNQITIGEESQLIYIDNKPTDVQVSSFLYDLQQPTKKIDQEAYSRILLVLRLEPDLVSNTYAKQILESYESEQEFFPTQQKSANRTRYFKTNHNRKRENKRNDKAKKRPIRKSGLVSSSERKTLEQLYSRGPASFGSSKRLQKHSKMSLAKVKSYLDTKPSFTKYRSHRMQFPRLKVIVKDINEIWSLDLAYVDNLAKYNRDVKYLLVAVDCLSRYLRVEPMKTKYATEAANAFKKMIKHKQPEKVWVDDGTEFLGAFKRLCNSRAIHLYSTFSEKKSVFAERNIRSLKNIIHRYLEEKWTYSYIDKLEDFVKTINSC